jgi:hypothetical protein
MVKKVEVRIYDSEKLSYMVVDKDELLARRMYQTISVQFPPPHITHDQNHVFSSRNVR